MEGDECTLDTDGDKIADYEVSKSFIIYYHWSIMKYIFLQCICMYILYKYRILVLDAVGRRLLEILHGL